MDRALRTHVGLPAAVTVQQFDLQVIERIEVGKAVAYAPREDRVVVQQALVPGDREHLSHRRLVLGGDAVSYTHLTLPTSDLV